MNDSKTRHYLTALLGLCVVLWFGFLLMRGTPVRADDLLPFSSVLTAATFAVAVFSRRLWSLRILHGWFVERPDLRGTWKGELVSEWVRSEGQRPPSIPCYVGVTQSLFALNLHVMTPESTSDLFAHAIRPLRDGTGYEVIGVYQNTPEVHLRDRSPMHFGAFKLETHGQCRSRPQRLEGEYWTDRQSLGTMRLFWCSRQLYTRFQDAGAALLKQDCPAR